MDRDREYLTTRADRILPNLRMVRQLYRALINPQGLEAKSFLAHEFYGQLSRTKAEIELMLSLNSRANPVGKATPEQKQLLSILASIERELRSLSRTLEGSEKLQNREGKNILVDHFDFGVRLITEPITVSTIENLLAALNVLVTKCYLLSAERYADFIAYNQARNPLFEHQAHFTIARVSYASPLDFGFNIDLSPKSVGEALQIAIDATVQARQRRRALELENEELEGKIRQQERRVESEITASLQDLSIAAEKAELDQERLRLSLERERIAIARDRIELQMKSVDWAIETATKMVTLFQAAIDEPARLMFIQGLVPQLLQLVNVEGLQLALPSPERTPEELDPPQYKGD